MNKLRFRSGQVHLRKVRVDANTVIEAGDLVWLDTDDAKPASAFAWTTNLATTQGNFAAKFLGVAHQPSAAGETAPISVDVSPDSVYEFDVASAAYELGTPLGPDENTSTLMSKQLETAVAAAAIARAAEFTLASVGTLRVTFASAWHTSSANVNAAIG
ncbi:DUF2190 family protein [Planctomicrobium piriforme]|uniref:Uncharacterized protein n=1 Tax=Planctomicrobium piriforme TaxID=1576369 RepID=A0A1I3TGR3_9PLAN|nr:DUF2190 family protein [Planctomicrobium piriforme]SFJ68831.1 hypothetical protein SAMN05421753_12925 [Planctomicrobium piriforme]